MFLNIYLYDMQNKLTKTNFVGSMWRSGLVGKLAVVMSGIVVLCIALFVIASTRGSSAARPARGTVSANSVFIAPTAVKSATPLPTDAALPTDTPLPIPTAAPIATTELSATFTPKEAAKQAAVDVCGKRFRSVSIEGGMLVVCELGDSFTAQLVIDGAVDDFRRIARAAMQAQPDLAYITVQMVAMFRDSEGNEAEQPAYTFRMRAALIQRVKWDNLRIKDVARLLARNDEEAGVGVHPVLRENWQQYLLLD
jgi:hypothetical protein